jgi:hypothetical protein
MKALAILMVFVLLAAPALASVRVCEPGDVAIVSGTDDMVDAGYAVAAWTHPAWGAIPGATWIWSSEYVVDPRNGETKTFTKMFYADVPTGGAIDILADNRYEVYLNGVPVGQDLGDGNYASVDSWPVTVQSGMNNLTIVGINIPWDTDDATVNPGGIAYKLTYTELCDNQVPEFGLLVAGLVLAAGVGLVVFRRK